MANHAINHLLTVKVAGYWLLLFYCMFIDKIKTLGNIVHAWSDTGVVIYSAQRHVLYKTLSLFSLFRKRKSFIYSTQSRLRLIPDTVFIKGKQKQKQKKSGHTHKKRKENKLSLRQ